MQIRIVTLVGELYSTKDVTSVTLDTVGGVIGIFPGHEPLIAQLIPGEISISSEGQKGPVLVAVSEGVVEVIDNNIRILAEVAEKADEIDIAAAKKAKSDAEKLIQAYKSGDNSNQNNQIDYIKLQNAIALENAKIRVGKKYKDLATKFR